MPVSPFRETKSPPGEKVKNAGVEAGGKLLTGFKETGLSPKTAFVNRNDNPKVSNFPVSNSSPQNPLPQIIVENSGGQTVPARELFRQTAASLGLPQDFLSAALIAFGRFFSLSPDAALLGNLRRELLLSLKSSSPKSADEKAALEAEALGAVAAADKGVVLGPEALERYARFFVPPVFTGDGEGGRGNSPEREELPEAEELQAAAEDEAQKDGLLDLLNAFPGKNGQYWLVFPLKLNVRGIELRVFIRILKRGPFFVEGKSGAAGEDARLIADIAGPKRQWRCFLDKKAGKFRADIRVFPALSEKALGSLRKDAERFLGKTGQALNFGGFEEILVSSAGEKPSWADDLFAEPLPFVNKEV